MKTGQNRKSGKLTAFFRSAGMILAFMGIGFFCGIAMVSIMESAGEISDGQVWEMMLILLIGLYVSMFLQIAAHEWGHYLFGRLTGYRFASFRLGSFMLIRQDGKLRLKRFSLAGTAGQCLMDPPDMDADGRFPYVLYNLGGSIVNLVLGLAGIGLALVPGIPAAAAGILFVFAITGIGFALLNGIPMQTAMVNNDGHNAMSLGKSPAALRSFWIQMKGNVLTSRGIRTKDMPAEWFGIPSPEELQNPMTAVLGVLTCNRLMDEGKIAETEATIADLLNRETAVVELHRYLLVCDRIFCLLVLGRAEEAAVLYDKKQKKNMKAVRNLPSVLRTCYSIALLLEKDAGLAEKIRQQFDSCEKTYPYPVECAGERELMLLAEQAARISEPAVS
ncbi:MAG: M50 family metallopeptidase [Clostridia bacterium]|nr:M50 family metallopeptidase [Clostridia bacterium]